jgi:hypothetical protein
VHGRDTTEVHADDLTLEFIDAATLTAARLALRRGRSC